jgi:hypothetical protein
MMPDDTPSDAGIYETIDVSVQTKFTKDYPLITPERKAKGDMRIEYDIDEETGEIGQINFAQAQVRNILNWLWNNDAITDQQHHDGKTFQIWRDMHHVQLGLLRPVTSGGTEPIGRRLRAYGYVLITKRLHVYDLKAINQSVDVFSNPHTTELARRDKKIYQRAFMNLSAAIMPIHEQIRYLEGLSDRELEAMSEENLKNYVAGLVKCR